MDDATGWCSIPWYAIECRTHTGADAPQRPKARGRRALWWVAGVGRGDGLLRQGVGAPALAARSAMKHRLHHRRLLQCLRHHAATLCRHLQLLQQLGGRAFPGFQGHV